MEFPEILFGCSGYRSEHLIRIIGVLKRAYSTKSELSVFKVISLSTEQRSVINKITKSFINNRISSSVTYRSFTKQ